MDRIAYSEEKMNMIREKVQTMIGIVSELEAEFRLHTEPQIGSRPQIRVNAVRQVGVRITSCIDQSCDVFGIFTIILRRIIVVQFL